MSEFVATLGFFWAISFCVGSVMGTILGLLGDWKEGFNVFIGCAIWPLFIIGGPFILIYKRLTL